MEHPYDYLLLFSVFALGAARLYLMIKNWDRVDTWKTQAKDKFSHFESSLEQPLLSYTCYTNHQGVWVTVKYDDVKNEILSRFISSAYSEATNVEFNLKSDEAAKQIYVGQGDDNFDWASIQHHEEWVESFKDISERIKQYKKKHFPEFRF